jgi:hypothetical protein
MHFICAAFAMLRTFRALFIIKWGCATFAMIIWCGSCRNLMMMMAGTGSATWDVLFLNCRKYPFWSQVALCSHSSRGFITTLLECPMSQNTAASESMRYSTAILSGSLPKLPGSGLGFESVQTSNICTIILRPHAQYIKTLHSSLRWKLERMDILHQGLNLRRPWKLKPNWQHDMQQEYADAQTHV